AVRDLDRRRLARVEHRTLRIIGPEDPRAGQLHLARAEALPHLAASLPFADLLLADGAVVLVDDVARGAEARDVAAIEPERSLAEPGDGVQVVRHEDDRPIALAELLDLGEALVLEILVPDR